MRERIIVGMLLAICLIFTSCKSDNWKQITTAGIRKELKLWKVQLWMENIVTQM